MLARRVGRCAHAPALSPFGSSLFHVSTAPPLRSLSQRCGRENARHIERDDQLWRTHRPIPDHNRKAALIVVGGGLKQMRVLIACEYSGAVRRAFRSLGHDAWSCDLLTADDGSPHHYEGDALVAAYGQHWDLMVAHPPCTYLSNSGVCHLKENPDRWAMMGAGATFFLSLLNAPIERIAVENPIMHGHAKRLFGIPRQTQVIQPWMFGHTEQKATCLWLKGLLPLAETNNVKAEMLALPDNERQRLHYLPPSPDRWKLRSTTYSGIAEAMAAQWGGLVSERLAA